MKMLDNFYFFDHFHIIPVAIEYQEIHPCIIQLKYIKVDLDGRRINQVSTSFGRRQDAPQCLWKMWLPIVDPKLAKCQQMLAALVCLVGGHYIQVNMCKKLYWKQVHTERKLCHRPKVWCTLEEPLRLHCIVLFFFQSFIQPISVS